MPDGTAALPGTQQLREIWVGEQACTVLRAAYATLDSTNLQARRIWEHRAASGYPPVPLVVVAETQTGGLGRSGRRWMSPEGGLWLSLAWPLRHPLGFYQALPLVAGLSVLEALRQVGVADLKLKWPNDVLAGDAKLSGVLCQSAAVQGAPMIIVGVGVNVNFRPQDLQGPLRTPATSVLAQVGHEVSLRGLEEDLVVRLLADLEHFEAKGWEAGFLQRLHGSLAWLGQPVCCKDAEGLLLTEGILLGVDTHGRLLLDAADGLQRLHAGELSLAPSWEPGSSTGASGSAEKSPP